MDKSEINKKKTGTGCTRRDGVWGYHIPFNIFVFCSSIYYPRTTLALLPSNNSDPGSHSGPSSSLSTPVRAFNFIARRSRYFLPSSTRVEMYLPKQLGALNK